MITEAPIDVSTVEAPADLRDLLSAEGLPAYAAVLAERPKETLTTLLIAAPPAVLTAASPEPVFVEPESEEQSEGESATPESEEQSV